MGIIERAGGRNRVTRSCAGGRRIVHLALAGLPATSSHARSTPGSSSSRRRPAGSPPSSASGPAAVYDISNACLGVLNGMIDIANRIELGQVRAGLVVSCETAREINDIAIDQMLKARTMDCSGLAGHVDRRLGAVAVLLTDGSFTGRAPATARRRDADRAAVSRPVPLGPGGRLPAGGVAVHRPATDSVAVLKHGVELGLQTWKAFLRRLGWREGSDRQGHLPPGRHRPPDTILQTLGIGRKRSTRRSPISATSARSRSRLTAGAGRGTRLPPAGRPRRLPRHRQRPELLDARGGVVNLP